MNGGGGESGDRGYDELQQEHERLKSELREQEEVISFVVWMYLAAYLFVVGHGRSSSGSYGVSEPDEINIRTRRLLLRTRGEDGC